MKPREILFPGKQAQRVKARSLLCYWAVWELGISTTSVANKLGMHESSVTRTAPASRHRKKRTNARPPPVLCHSRKRLQTMLKREAKLRKRFDKLSDQVPQLSRGKI